MTGRDVGHDGGSAETAAVSDALDGEADAPAVPWLRAVVQVAVREYRIAVRSRWTLGLTVLFAVFSVGVVGFGTSSVGPDRYAAVVASLVELGVYLVPLAALTVGYDTVVGAEETGALDMLFALPISQAQVVVGKYLGRAAVLAGATAVGASVGGVGAVLVVGPSGVGPYALFVLAAVVTGAAFLGVSVLLSTLARAKTQALGAALVAWVWFVLLHDLVAVGLIAAADLPGPALTAMALSNPADVFRLLVLSRLSTTAGGFAAVLAETNLSTATLVATLVAWVVVPVGLAAVAIDRRR